MEGDKKQKSKKEETSDTCSDEGVSENNGTPAGTTEQKERGEHEEVKATEVTDEESQHRQYKNEPTKEQPDKTSKTESKTIGGCLPNGGSKEKPLGETDGRSDVQQNDEKSDNGKQNLTSGFSHSAVENNQHQQLVQDQRLRKSVPKGPDSSGLSAEHKVLLPAPRVGRMEALKGVISQFLNLSARSKDQVSYCRLTYSCFVT